MNAAGPRRERLITASVVALGLLVRLPFLPVDYHATSDVAALKGWARTLAADGLPAAYAGTTVNYPPVSIFWLAVAGWIDARFGAIAGPGAREGLLTALVKLPGVLADLLTAWLIAAASGAWPPGRRRLVAALYLFNPAVWYVSAYWGQVDSVFTLFMVASVIALEGGRVGPAWLACALAVSTKLQSLALAPLVAVVTWLEHGRRGMITGGLVGAAAATLLAMPWLATGHGAELAAAVWPHDPPRVVVSGYNLWYLLLLGRAHNVSSLLHPLGLPFNYKQIGIGLYGIFVLIVIGLVWRNWRAGPGRPGPDERAAVPRRSLAEPAALLAFGLFMLVTEIHERYSFPALALLLLAASAAREQRPAEGLERFPRRFIDRSRGSAPAPAILRGVEASKVGGPGKRPCGVSRIRLKARLWRPYLNVKTALGYSTGLAYAALSLTCLFNLVTIAPFASWLGANLVAASSGTPGELALKGLSLACAAANLALLALMVRRQAASSPRPVAEAR